MTLLAKALRPLPEKWHGLTDPEQVYRQRYLDLIVNPESRQRLRLRSRIVACIRRVLESRQFIEVETPVLQNIAGGAAARPFVTRHNALGVDFFLRISLELHLKRLLVGGYDRVYEIGRNFRNEGVSRRHNPEFTMLEVYQAYSDYRGMMTLIRDLIMTLCTRTSSAPTKIKQPAERPGHRLRCRLARGELQGPDPRRDGRPGVVHPDQGRARGGRREAGPQGRAAVEDFEITNEMFSKRIEPNLIQPTFVLNLPKELYPLAKINPADPTTLDVFELCISGMEMAPGLLRAERPRRAAGNVRAAGRR